MCVIIKKVKQTHIPVLISLNFIEVVYNRYHAMYNPCRKEQYKHKILNNCKCCNFSKFRNV